MSTTQAPPLKISADISADHVACYNEEGYVVLRGLLTDKDVTAIRCDVMHIMDTIGLGMTRLRQTTEYLAGTALEGLINHPALRQIASTLMDGQGSLYMPFTAVKSGGGGGRFHFHQDNQYTTFDAPGINLWFALVDMTPDNGCLQIVPRSHLQGTLFAHDEGDGLGVTFLPEDFVSIPMRAGDCVAFSRLTVHGSGFNITTEPRVAYAVQFHRDDARAKWLPEHTEPVLLKEAQRWRTTPVEKLTVPDGPSDGH